MLSYPYSSIYATKSSTATHSRSCKCNGCKFPFYVCEKLASAVRASSATASDELKESALTRIEDTRSKFRLFMEHRCRVINQRCIKAKLHEEMKSDCRQFGMSQVAVTIDWKMRFEGKSTRETTQEFYGKRNMGWHGGMIEFYKMGSVEGEDGSVETGPVHYKYQVDQIMAAENKQDATAVLSVIEAMLIQVEDSLEPIMDGEEIAVTFVSDNAGCYQSKTLKLLLPLVNKKFSGALRIHRYFQTETQDGKSELDAGFGKASNHTRKYMMCKCANKIRKIKTPAG